MKTLSRIALAAMVAVSIGVTLGAMWVGLPHDSISEAAAIFAIAFLAAIAAIFFFVRGNERNIENAVRTRDRSALKRIVFGKRRGKSD